MPLLSDLRSLSPRERHTIAASYLGWMLDAFDFFILVFVLKDVAAEFGTDPHKVSLAITLTLAMRPLGALLFGLMADKFGRRPTLMIDVLLYSILEFASGFAPDLTTLIVLRALYGVAMGGEWGVGASLTMETVPPKLRGIVSGILQAGYPSGYLLASIVYFALFPVIGWRGMFMVGVIPALLVLYIRRHVDESPAFTARQHLKERQPIGAVLKGHVGIFIWAVLLMAGFNFLSHGTQDIYPTFLLQQRNLSSHEVGAIAITYNIGAILGGLTFGALSEKIGRRKAIAIAAVLALPAIPLWIHAASPAGLAAGAFIIQFFVQGAWGVVPVHLNEMSPDAVRGTFPGFAYQIGNLLASYNATLQTGMAQARNGNYAFALAAVTGIAALSVALLSWFGHEARGRAFGHDEG
jgi:SHS family lactate transporter-like MFS transporter